MHKQSSFHNAGDSRQQKYGVGVNAIDLKELKRDLSTKAAKNQRARVRLESLAAQQQHMSSEISNYCEIGQVPGSEE